MSSTKPVNRVRPPLKSEFLCYVWDKHPVSMTYEGKIVASADIDGLMEKFNKLSYDKKRVYRNMLNAEEERKTIFEQFVEGTTPVETVEKDVNADGDAQDAKDTLANRDPKTKKEGVITSTVKKVCEYVFRQPGAHKQGEEPGPSGLVKKPAKERPPSTNDFVCYVWKNHPELVTVDGRILASADVDRLHAAFTKLEYNKKNQYWRMANTE